MEAIQTKGSTFNTEKCIPLHFCQALLHPSVEFYIEAGDLGKNANIEDNNEVRYIVEAFRKFLSSFQCRRLGKYWLYNGLMRGLMYFMHLNEHLLIDLPPPLDRLRTTRIIP